MAIVALTDTWILEDYAQVFDASNIGEYKESPTLAGLSHFAFPGLTWRIELCPRGDDEPNYAPICVRAQFGFEWGNIYSVWAKWTATIVSDNAQVDLQQTSSLHQYLLGGTTAWCKDGAKTFLQAALASAVRTDGHLAIKLDLTLFKVVDLLKCRDTVRALLSHGLHADVEVNVGGKSFKAHNAILAKECTGFHATAVPAETTAEAFEAFLGVIYFDKFEFSTWQIALGVLQLAHKFDVGFLKGICDHALAELIPSVDPPDLLQILPEAIHCNALISKAACLRGLADDEEVVTSAGWSEFKAFADMDVLSLVSDDALLAQHVDDELKPRPTVFHAAEIKLVHTWTVSHADVGNAIAPQPMFIMSQILLEHTAFPGVKWQLEFHPHGNTSDASYTPGYASLYLKAIFGSGVYDMKAVYANWKATIIVKDQPQVSTPDLPDYILYTGAKSMTQGYANAFPFQQSNAALNANRFYLSMKLELTIVSIEEMLECSYVISSLHSDKSFADIEIDVNGRIFKAHKFVLAARSPVFARMFKTDTKESQTGKVEVKDTTRKAFRAFLEGIYYRWWSFLSDMDATMDVLELSERYAVADLKRYCDEALAHFVDEANVFDVLIHAALHNADATKASCLQVLFAKEELIACAGWIKFKKAVKKEIFADVIEAIHKHFARPIVSSTTVRFV